MWFLTFCREKFYDESNCTLPKGTILKTSVPRQTIFRGGINKHSFTLRQVFGLPDLILPFGSSSKVITTIYVTSVLNIFGFSLFLELTESPLF